jgi:hypothetical protein
MAFDLGERKHGHRFFPIGVVRRQSWHVYRLPVDLSILTGEICTDCSTCCWNDMRAGQAVGLPTAAMDPHALDLQEWHHWQQMPVSRAALTGLLGPLQVPLACPAGAAVRPPDAAASLEQGPGFVSGGWGGVSEWCGNECPQTTEGQRLAASNFVSLPCGPAGNESGTAGAGPLRRAEGCFLPLGPAGRHSTATGLAGRG